MRRLWSWLARWIDLRDAITFVGLAAACYGLYQVYPPAAWIVGGAALFWLGVRE